MKRKYFLFLFFAACSFFSVIQAQKRATIIDDLETFVVGEGIIHIDADPALMDLIGSFSADSSALSDSIVKMNGFRIQVFMSNDPRTGQKEIASKGSMIKSAFPEISVYTDYAAPNIKLLAGDFLTREEADVFKQKIQKSIPALGKEMYVVQDKVNIRMQKNN